MKESKSGFPGLKKVLIITYYWPPAGGPGVQRWLKFAKYLPSFGIQPIIYTPENPTYPLLDYSLESEVSDQLEVLKSKIKEPYGLAGLFSKKSAKNLSSGIIPHQPRQSFIEKSMLWVRGNLFIPDARIGWVKPSVNFLETYIRDNNIDCVITTGPPHSLHLIGLELKKRLAFKWIADFRDPWTTIGYHKELKLTASAQHKHEQLELAVLNAADQLTVTSFSTKAEFAEKTTKPITVLTNGYDVEVVEKRPMDKAFTLAHIGSFLSHRNPRVLWKALSELRKENPEFKEAFQFKLIGKVSQEILDALKEFKLDDCTVNMGYLSHKEALVQQRVSQVLLLVEIDSLETRAIIPGKLFEYMAAERPILALGPDGADFFRIITETNTGRIALYDEKEVIKEILLDCFTKYQKGELKVYGMGLQYYSRKKITEQLAKLIQS
ncbi:glycosyltransferase family 4 protein [Flavobacterium sp. NKUCC04_CG]|uniref:glycosyltransferase family 4 protein n=1 Tax=Flavobacterium sp. NKUCC04_CG TaxID=2842121 RepID=UPI001C5AAD63|nr:glycosyltransferase family 4 protein [Flavobacterium sp. NKUCC04_CG]MBW3519106.1 glycosyltransferase family 4 protein [Flavobacterium sp. NKUCC04_CG]